MTDYEQIHSELKKFYTPDEAYAWLSSTQQTLGLRIPARMIATGEASAVLEALRSRRDATAG